MLSQECLLNNCTLTILSSRGPGEEWEDKEKGGNESKKVDGEGDFILLLLILFLFGWH